MAGNHPGVGSGRPRSPRSRRPCGRSPPTLLLQSVRQHLFTPMDTGCGDRARHPSSTGVICLCTHPIARQKAPMPTTLTPPEIDRRHHTGEGDNGSGRRPPTDKRTWRQWRQRKLERPPHRAPRSPRTPRAGPRRHVLRPRWRSHVLRRAHQRLLRDQGQRPLRRLRPLHQ